MCVRNFKNLRGAPIGFYSDNGTNFKAADKELRADLIELEQDKTLQCVSNIVIEMLNNMRYSGENTKRPKRTKSSVPAGHGKILPHQMWKMNVQMMRNLKMSKNI